MQGMPYVLKLLYFEGCVTMGTVGHYSLRSKEHCYLCSSCGGVVGNTLERTEEDERHERLQIQTQTGH